MDPVSLALLVLAPELWACDLARFPDAAYTREAVRLNREYAAHLQAQLTVDFHREAQLTEALEETYRLWWLWDCLRCAHEGNREWLPEMRRLLGEGRWLRGEMPPPVPLWRFTERD